MTAVAFTVVELYVGVPTAAVPQAGTVAVPVAAHTGHVVQTRSVVTVPAVLIHVPSGQVLSATHAVTAAAAVLLEGVAVVFVVKFAPSVHAVQTRSFEAEPAVVVAVPARQTFQGAHELEFVVAVN